MDAIFALLIIAVLAAMAHFLPFPLGPQANTADTHYLPRPEWYYIPIFQWLKYWPGALSFVGVVLIPSIIAFFFASVPFLDRRMERRPWKRPIAVGTYVFIFLALFGLGVLSYRSDHNDPGYAAQLIAQDEETNDFMHKPFAPEQASVLGPAGGGVIVDAMVSKGEQLFQAQSCNACHGDAGAGTVAAPKLIGLHARVSKDQLVTLLKTPTPKMLAGGMTPSTVPPEQINALVAYVESL